jgi:hypothetical protein
MKKGKERKKNYELNQANYLQEVKNDIINKKKFQFKQKKNKKK